MPSVWSSRLTPWFKVIESALRAGGRRRELLFCSHADLSGVAPQAAGLSLTARPWSPSAATAPSVALSAHAVGCAIGLVPQGTFNHFARMPGISAEATEAVRLLLRAAPAPAQVAGNHDIALFDLGARLTRPFARNAAAFGAELEPVHASQDLLIVGVNTTRAWRRKNGEVSAAQIDRVAKLLTAASAPRLRVVVVHQPASATQTRDRSNLLRGRGVAQRVWSAAAADSVMAGHIHLPNTLAPHGLARRLWRGGHTRAA